MNREIKFRAWDTVGGVMYLPDTTDWECYHLTLSGEVSEASFYGYYDTLNRKDITERTVLMQFTGKKSTGIVQDVFDGDICSATFRDAKGVHELTGKIVMDEYMWCIETADDTYSLNRVTIIDVLGNIYEHPYLIK